MLKVTKIVVDCGKIRDMKSKEETEKECWNHFYIHSGVFDYLIDKLSEFIR